MLHRLEWAILLVVSGILVRGDSLGALGCSSDTIRGY